MGAAICGRKGTQKCVGRIRLQADGIYAGSKKLKQEGKIEIFDIPQTVRVAFQAVEMTMGKDYIGNKELLIKTKQKESDNFVSTLKNLMKEDPFAQKYVVIREGSLEE